MARPDGRRIEGETVQLEVTRTASTSDGSLESVVTKTVPANGIVSVAVSLPGGNNWWGLKLTTKVIYYINYYILYIRTLINVPTLTSNAFQNLSNAIFLNYLNSRHEDTYNILTFPVQFYLIYFIISLSFIIFVKIVSSSSDCMSVYNPSFNDGRSLNIGGGYL